MSIETTRELIRKIATGNYTNEELATFLEAVKTMDKAPFMEAYHFLYEEINKYSPEELAPDFKDQLEKRLDLLEAEKGFLPGNLVSAPSQRETVPFRRKWWNYAAAAAILLFSLTGYFLWNNHKKQIQIAGRPVKRDLQAGQQGAILTLSNGQKIILDSAGNGVLTSDAGVQIIRKDGELSYGGKTDEIIYNQIVTPKGRQWELTLSDGTKVWLNAASSIRYPLSFVGKQRVVELTGEAYFEVAPDKNKPFRIYMTGKGEVEVLGTHFNINAYDDEPTINTTLLEGSVKVNAQEQGNPQSIVLKPGQQAQMSNGHIAVADSVNTDQVTAWKNGYFSFNGATTEAIMRQIGRWYDAQIVYEGNVKDERFAGSVPRSANASKLLEVLALTKTVQFIIEDKKIIVKPFHP